MGGWTFSRFFIIFCISIQNRLQISMSNMVWHMHYFHWSFFNSLFQTHLIDSQLLITKRLKTITFFSLYRGNTLILIPKQSTTNIIRTKAKNRWLLYILTIWVNFQGKRGRKILKCPNQFRETVNVPTHWLLDTWTMSFLPSDITRKNNWTNEFLKKNHKRKIILYLVWISVSCKKMKNYILKYTINVKKQNLEQW